ncbi:hypothetical protein Cgig2_018734 [Carnegiea gigantea]|uniref:Uncharacterized protein n=1 Tax=Carnegiea gigantea TaxID=171969 RepID=A0A9Q1GS74_9CARY|nr:hypothetical protein Cgig2_018734 [Carnegiea gigantea]
MRGRGISDVALKHRCTFEAVCSLNSELEDFQKSAIEETLWSPALKYKSFIMDRHPVRALVESWNPETKAFKISYIEVSFSGHDMALLTGLPATGKHVMFEQGQGACEVEEVVKASMDARLMREMIRPKRGQTLSLPSFPAADPSLELPSSPPFSVVSSSPVSSDATESHCHLIRQ